jgi:hypothetical protein
MKVIQNILAATVVSSALAFAPNMSNAPLTPIALKASTKESFDPLHLTEPKCHEGTKTLATFAATAAASFALSPMAALAGELQI